MSLRTPKLQGMIAATFTPMNQRRELLLERVAPMVDFLVQQGVAGLYVMGSTGEGPSLTFDERCAASEAFIAGARERIPVIVQVGSESLKQSQQLAAHAQSSGAYGVSAVCPVYFKPDSLSALVDSMREIALGAPQLPFYYYHIPIVTGVNISALDFLRLGSERIENLRGVKFTSTLIFEYQACVEFAPERLEILFGSDEMVISALAAGGTAAVGSTYNFAMPIYRQLLSAWNAGDIATARLHQSRSQALVRAFVKHGARAAQKSIMAMIGFDCGPSRLPIADFSAQQFAQLQQDLTDVGFFDWLKA